MLTHDLQLTVHGKNHATTYTVDINAYWVTIRHGQNVIYKRTADKGPWLDGSHTLITKALSQLEDALRSAIEQQQRQGPLCTVQVDCSTVHQSRNSALAKSIFRNYVEMSKAPFGEYSGKHIALFENAVQIDSWAGR